MSEALPRCVASCGDLVDISVGEVVLDQRTQTKLPCLIVPIQYKEDVVFTWVLPESAVNQIEVAIQFFRKELLAKYGEL